MTFDRKSYIRRVIERELNSTMSQPSRQKLQDDIHMLVLLEMKIKEHEENVKSLKTQNNKLDDSILDLQGINENNSQPQTEEQTTEQILQHEKSAAAILCQLKKPHGTQASHRPLTKDVLGIVATLGKVNDDNLSRLFAEYLGVETMLAIVCKTYKGVNALEAYDNEGCINKSSGLHGLGASIGRALDGRFLVICLENIIPYAGGFVADDPQRRFDIIKPRFPNGECPPGFLGFAVNMINVDNTNLFCLTASGYGLRETLFYKLFSRLQVYKTREEMLLALPCISDGALSLDGGMIRSAGAFSLGNREDVDVKFPKPLVTSTLRENYIEVERQVKEMKGKKEKMLEDMKREEALLHAAKFDFDKKKQEFLKFLAESSSNATQNCSAPTPPKELAMSKMSTPSSRNMAVSSKKRSRDTVRFGSEAADLAYHERFQSQTLILERKIAVSDFEEPQFAFVLRIFESRGWESLVLRHYLVYPKIVREFYANIHKIKMDPPSFETYVREAKIVVNAELLSEVAEIPLVPEPGYPFGNPELPSKDTMMTKFASADGPSWYEHESSVPLARFTPAMHLLARIILQNVWPIDQHTEMGVERAKFMFAMVDEVPIDFCTHAIVAMIEAFHDKTTSLPYAGLISKIVRQKRISIPDFERYQSSSSFGKASVPKSLAQFSRQQKRGLPQAHKVPAPAAEGASSSVSMPALMKEVKALIRMIGNIEKRVKSIDERTAKIEKRQEPRGEHFEQHLAAGGNQNKRKKIS